VHVDQRLYIQAVAGRGAVGAKRKGQKHVVVEGYDARPAVPRKRLGAGSVLEPPCPVVSARVVHEELGAVLREDFVGRRIEILGERELVDAYGGPAEAPALEAALRTLIDLQAVTDPAIPPYTIDRLRDELGIFSEWFAAGLLETSLPAALQSAFEGLAGQVAGQLSVCVHRDYHCRNLLFDPDTGRLGVVDFQDALIGPVSYDLASLLHDCYHRFSVEDVARWRDWYLQHSPLDLDPKSFAADLTHTAIQRQLKAVGIFTRLCLRDGKVSHLVHILPVLESLSSLARHQQSLAPLSDWLDGLDRDVIAARIGLLAEQTTGTT